MVDTILEFAALFNASGVGLVLLVSFLVLRRYPASFFRPWILAYAAIFAFLISECYATVAGRGTGLALFEVAAMTTAVWFEIQTVLHFRGQRLPSLGLWVVIALNMALAGALMAAGTPFQLAALLPELGMAFGPLWLGATMLRGRGISSDVGLNWLGLPLILMGCLPFAFPVIIGTPYAWVGYWAGGLLNTLVGVGMVVYLLENTSARLRENNRELRQLDQMKTNFLATVSHELRTPLAAIKGAASVLSSPVGETSSPKLVPIVLNNAVRLEGLIQDLLDVTSIEAGRMQYHRKPADLGTIVSEAASACASQFDDRELTFSLRVPAEPIWSTIDASRLYQVVSNLLVNAAKFTDPGGSVMLTLKCEGDEAVLEVEDTGIGIAPEHHRKVFQKFYQVDGGDTRRANGSGLGLSIVKAIVEEGHGGRIELESQLGVGTTFRARLPLTVEDAPVEQEKTLTGS